MKDDNLNMKEIQDLFFVGVKEANKKASLLSSFSFLSKTIMEVQEWKN